MIQFPESIADAYVRPARNISMPSAPGRTVRFLQGHAVLKDGRDMVAMLKRGDVTIHLTPYAASWMDTWFEKAGEVKAEVLMPEPVTVPVHESAWDASLVKVARGTNSTEPDPRTE